MISGSQRVKVKFEYEIIDKDTGKVISESNHKIEPPKKESK